MAIAALAAAGTAFGSVHAAAAAPAAPPAGASATVSGVATPPTGTSPDVTVTFTVTVTGAPTEVSGLAVTDPATLVADPASVLVDGAAAPAGTAAATATGLQVQLGTGATSASGGVLAVGAHTVSYRADATDARTGATVSAQFGYVGTSGPATAASGPVPVPLPDLVVTTPPDSGEDTVLPLSAGQDGVFAAVVTDAGAATDAATLTVTLPAGLRIDPSFGIVRQEFHDLAPLTCTTAGQVVRCALGALASKASETVLVPVQVTDDAPIGVIGRFTVAALAASGVDGAPANNSVSGAVRYVGTTTLRVTLTGGTEPVQVGASTTVGIALTNESSTPAADAFGLVGLVDAADPESDKPHFTITAFTGKTIDLGDGSGPPPTLESVVGHRRAALVRPLHGAAAGDKASGSAKAKGQPVLFWDIGTVAAGATIHERATVQALRPGKDLLLVIASDGSDGLDGSGSSGSGDDSGVSDSDDSGCALSPAHPQATGIDCADIVLTAIAAKHAPSTSSASPVATDPVADTGAPTGQLTVVALLAILAGAVLLRLGIVRRQGRHRG